MRRLHRPILLVAGVAISLALVAGVEVGGRGPVELIADPIGCFVDSKRPMHLEISAPWLVRPVHVKYPWSYRLVQGSYTGSVYLHLYADRQGNIRSHEVLHASSAALRRSIEAAIPRFRVRPQVAESRLLYFSLMIDFRPELARPGAAPRVKQEPNPGEGSR